MLNSDSCCLNFPMKMILSDVEDFETTLTLSDLSWQVQVKFNREGKDLHLNIVCKDAAKRSVHDRLQEIFHHYETIYDGGEVQEARLVLQRHLGLPFPARGNRQAQRQQARSDTANAQAANAQAAHVQAAHVSAP